ncbi:MAG TPA: hypothetical protein V6C88_13040 [Chroococcidiopsis sp.]
MTIHELLGSDDPARIDAMLNLYAEFFPQYAQYVPRMRRRAQFSSVHNPKFVSHYWLIEVNGQPAGLRTFRYVRSRHCGLAHSFVIHPHYRHHSVDGLRLSLFVVKSCLQQVINDALEAQEDPVYGMINEVEADRLMKHYSTYGIVELPVQYVEPIFPSSDAGYEAAVLSPMHLGFLPAPGQDAIALQPHHLRDFVLAFLVDHYGLPESHPAVQSSLQSIQKSIQKL